VSRSTVKWMLVAVGIAGLGAAAWAVSGSEASPAGGCCPAGMMAGRRATAGPAPAAQAANDAFPAKALSDLDALVQSAKASAEAGDAKAAAVDLAKAQKVLAILRAHMTSCPMTAQTAAPVNTYCPIMGGKIDPAHVRPDSTRQFNGQTIAFCCGGCPAQWDKLDDQHKQAKLDQHKAPELKADPHGGHH